MKLLGKDRTFFQLLQAQADAAFRAAQEFHALSQDFEHRADHARRIEEIEHEADDFTHQLANRTDATFVTPLDKEDLHKLSSALDDITDFVEAASGRIALYQLSVPRPDLPPLVSLLVDTVRATADAVNLLDNPKNRKAFHEALIRIHELENRSDKAFREALATLFNTPGNDAIMVIKWKEIYDRIEIATDKCEDVATVLESVVVKYA